LAFDAFPSFRFRGKKGHFTARKEQRQRDGDYWFAYRRQGKQLICTSCHARAHQAYL
jgi:hypothetical protein